MHTWPQSRNSIVPFLPIPILVIQLLSKVRDSLGYQYHWDRFRCGVHDCSREQRIVLLLQSILATINKDLGFGTELGRECLFPDLCGFCLQIKAVPGSLPDTESCSPPLANHQKGPRCGSGLGQLVRCPQALSGSQHGSRPPTTASGLGSADPFCSIPQSTWCCGHGLFHTSLICTCRHRLCVQIESGSPMHCVSRSSSLSLSTSAPCCSLMSVPSKSLYTGRLKITLLPQGILKESSIFYCEM